MMKDLSKEEMITLLNKAEDGVLALSDESNPYCIPIGYVCVNNKVCFSIFPKGRKWDCFQKNRKVCFNVYVWNDEHTQWSSVVIDGEMVPVTDLAEIESVVKGTIEKMGLDPEAYLAKRMEYYKKNLDNPEALKLFKIETASMGGKTMQTMIGK
jgi:nitroimidazol reductase NimA-like FMN-containing flavoprotein (pyridoxamine 5'-phosphate oxidase superfamily)